MVLLSSSDLQPWFRRLVGVVRIFGYVAIIVMALYTLGALGNLLRHPYDTQSRVYVALEIGRTVNSFGYAMAILGLVQLLSFIFGDVERPGWLLRHADMGLYVWALWGFVYWILGFWYLPYPPYAAERPAHFWFMIGLGLTSWMMRAVLMVVIGLVLRRVLPILEESRAVV